MNVLDEQQVAQLIGCGQSRTASLQWLSWWWLCSLCSGIQSMSWCRPEVPFHLPVFHGAPLAQVLTTRHTDAKKAESPLVWKNVPHAQNAQSSAYGRDTKEQGSGCQEEKTEWEQMDYQGKKKKREKSEIIKVECFKLKNICDTRVAFFVVSKMSTQFINFQIVNFSGLLKIGVQPQQEIGILVSVAYFHSGSK